jgi:EAL domain-containing protein (putative c-di-GMP-specific phosphodiesterase class I)/CheY-like chemotaxis protein
LQKQNLALTVNEAAMNDAVQALSPRPGQAQKEAAAAEANPMPICFVVDSDANIRRLMFAELRGLQVQSDLFETAPEMLKYAEKVRPDLLFVDITTSLSSAVELIGLLAMAQLPCPVQIMTGLNPVLIEQVKRIGERNGLRLLPVLHKPFRPTTIRKVLHDLRLRRDRAATGAVTLEEIIRNRWLELWYQPKIDLRANVMVGAEAFVRARHPELGVLGPDAFLWDATEEELVDMTPRVIGRVIGDCRSVAAAGVSINFSINIPVSVLSKLSLFGIMWEERTEGSQGPGLILEITEEEVLPNLSQVRAAARELRAYGITFAVDGFGVSYAELLREKDLPFAEIKIDRSYISNCDTDPLNAGLCETLVEFAHRFNISAVAEGIETKGELQTLRDIGCDMAQGYFFARPMPKDKFAKMVLEHAKQRKPA